MLLVLTPRTNEDALSGQVPRDTGLNFQHWRPYRATSSSAKPHCFTETRDHGHADTGSNGQPGSYKKLPRPPCQPPISDLTDTGLDTCEHVFVLFYCDNKTSFGNDPSAGSPTETLLRLLLPLNDQVWESFQHKKGVNLSSADPNASLNHSIGSSDGRCVQRAGT